ncbi:MAG: OmpH family outer membrane protein [Gammaproteobacteria bacterium]|nr:MAG: OmpH family outer membrane protein [Gammaproteobacteria bacterium]
MRTRQWIPALLAAAALLLPVLARADVRIGFVNTVKLMEKAPQAKAAIAKIEAEFAPREKEIVALQREIKKMEEKLSKEGPLLSEEKRHQAERKLITKRRELKRRQDEFREDLNIRRNEELSRLQKQLYNAIVKFAKEEHYDLIVSEGVVYAGKRVDVTDRLLERLRKEAGK